MPEQFRFCFCGGGELEEGEVRASDGRRESLTTRVKHLFWWCAGADLETLKACPSDHTRFTALGMMMAVVPCLATVSFTFFLQQSFDLGAVALLGGAAWGVILFVLDRLILTFHRKGQREKLRAVPRLALAVCLAVVIGGPLLLRFFSSADLLPKVEENSKRLEQICNAPVGRGRRREFRHGRSVRRERGV